MDKNNMLLQGMIIYVTFKFVFTRQKYQTIKRIKPYSRTVQRPWSMRFSFRKVDVIDILPGFNTHCN